MAFLDETGATILADEVKTYVGNTAVAKEAGKGLSTNDYTTTEKNKLAGIANGANKTIVDSSLSSTSTNPVQNKVVNTEFGKKLDKDGDSKDLTNTFVAQDSTNVTQWTDVDVLTSAEKHSSIFNKISTMFKNIRYLYKMLGTADISTLGDGADIGTVTGALSKLNSDLNTNYVKAISGKTTVTTDQYGTCLIHLDFSTNVKYTVIANTIGEGDDTLILSHSTYSTAFKLFAYNYNPFQIIPNRTLTINWTVFLNE